ncbi:hypothetical protein BRYFOR_06966 [Marvinbryantia formatexigens DSM 14469]|uniref:Uncharacterized protein n=1 Tax=Marvinbryantia formatexigens DSM 14469 TaxID=478749 RepID=C6LEB7_9FIRM|nr:hypothetical protein BRYFOR_06966 [Marvinbryantia formatexigens DSM 14469]
MRYPLGYSRHKIHRTVERHIFRQQTIGRFCRICEHSSIHFVRPAFMEAK